MATDSSYDPFLAVLFLAISAGIGYVLYRRTTQDAADRELLNVGHAWGGFPTRRPGSLAGAAQKAKQVAREYGPKAYSVAKKASGKAASHASKAGKAAYGFGKDVYGGVVEGVQDFDIEPLVQKAKAGFAKPESKRTVFSEPLPEAFQIPRRTELAQSPDEYVRRGEAYTVPGKRGARKPSGVAKTAIGMDPELIARLSAEGYEKNRRQRKKRKRT